MLAQDMSEKLRIIYDTAFTQNRWQAALDAMGSVTEARAVLLYNANDNFTVPYSLNAASSDYARLYPDSDVLIDYTLARDNGGDSGYDARGLASVHQSPAFKALPDDHHFKIDHAYDERPEVMFCKERMGVYRRFAVNLSEDPLNFAGMLFHYDRRFDAGVPVEDMRTVEPLAPHMAKAVEMNRVMNGLRTKYNAVLSVLDRIDIAICILDVRGQVFLANRQGQALLDSQDGLAKGRDGRLTLASDDDTAHALDAIRRVAQTARGENDDTSEVIEVTRRSTGTALYGMVSPLRDADMELEAGLHGALLTVIDPAKPVRTRVEAAARAYGLTPAEERVAVLLAGGMANADIAESLSVSPETVKSHIASIFGKMQCRSRSAYIWRIFQFSPPIL